MLLGVCLLALLLRAWGLDFGLPSLYHPDEPTHVTIVERIIKTGDLNPHFFDYPSLFFYIHTLAYLPYFLAGKLLGVFQSVADIPYPVVYQLGVGTTTMPTTFMLGRWVTVLFGVGTVALVYVVGKRLFDKPQVGLLAALLTAVSPANVVNSRFITPNMMLSFFGVLALLGATLVLRRGDTRYYVLAGLGAGLTASIKYNGALIIIVLAAAHFLREGPRGLKDWRIYMAPILAAALFFATTPFAILDSAKFLNDVRLDAAHYSTAHFGMEGDALAWYIDYLWAVEGFIVALAVLEALRGLILRSKPLIMLSIFPVVYFVFISTFVVRNDRTVMPLLPFLALLGSSFLFYLLESPGPSRPLVRRAITGVSVAVMILSVTYPLVQTVTRSEEAQLGVASRNAARDWVNLTLPPGSRVAVEAYGPVIDDKRFQVAWIGRLTDHPASWYAAQGFQYLVFSGGIFNRFYREPDKYAGDVQLYDTLFQSLQPVRSFPGAMYEIRVYQVRGK